VPTVDIPGIKRAGLPVDLDRLTAEGDDWLSPEERYALKTYGVCAQAQPHVFMVRVRTNGALQSATARALAGLAEQHGGGWIHLTTRQQIEFHHVHATKVAGLLEEIHDLGLTTSSACGHTMRGVMSCPLAGVGLDEPFDCSLDARLVTDAILARARELNTQMPQRVNISFGGCAECRDHAKVNDAGFVSKVSDDGQPCYELLLGGSLGKSSPMLALTAVDMLPRQAVLPAVYALFELFIEHGDFERPSKARLKFLIQKMGEDAFLKLYLDLFEEHRQRSWPDPPPVTLPLSSSISEILSYAPEGGWSAGVRPQRVPGWALVTINVPLGDIYADELRLLADVADDLADQHLHLTRNQNVMLRWVPVEAVSAVKAALARVGLFVEGADQARDVRACTGGPICSLAITPAQAAATRLLDLPSLSRNSELRISVSGCPNACAQHQIADLGFSGGMVTIAGCQVLGYQVWAGADLREHRLSTVIGRVAESDVAAITEAIVGVWEALRERGEKLSDTIRRFGAEAFKAQIGAVFKGRWEPGPEPDGALPGLVREDAQRRLPLVRRR
jgi:sulfite reductase beta subunit-like hemoprotein